MKKNILSQCLACIGLIESKDYQKSHRYISFKLTLIDRNDVLYRNLTQSIQEEQLNNEFDLKELGHLIKNRLHLFKSTNKLFKQVLFQQKQELRTIILHYNMGIIYDALGEYEKISH